jgi:hypothetical protein
VQRSRAPLLIAVHNTRRPGDRVGTPAAVLAVVADVPRARLSGPMKARLRVSEPYVAGLLIIPFCPHLGGSE